MHMCNEKAFPVYVHALNIEWSWAFRLGMAQGCRHVLEWTETHCRKFTSYK